jgi:hypothetical protein
MVYASSFTVEVILYATLVTAEVVFYFARPVQSFLDQAEVICELTPSATALFLHVISLPPVTLTLVTQVT